MKKIAFFFIAFLLGFNAFGQDFPQQKIDSKIEHVTVFLSGAQVVRTASATIQNGKSEVLLRGLSPNLETQSVTVKGEGDFTILSIKPQLNFLEEVKRKDTILALESEREKLFDLLIRDSTEVLILRNEEEILMRNRVQVIGLQGNTDKTEDLSNLLDLQRKRLKDIYDKKFELQKISEKRHREIHKISAQLTELNVKKSTTTAEVLVTVFVKNTPSVLGAKFTLEYLVPNTNWYPTYDLRVKDVTAPMQAQMKAKVRQNSGEDWREVKLTLSTGEPKRTGVKPELGTWILGEFGSSNYIGQRINEVEDFTRLRLANQSNKVKGRIRDDQSGEPLVGASVVVFGTTRGAVTDVDGNFELEVNPNDRDLSVSYTGYLNITTPIVAGNFVDLSLKESLVLSEVVVTGYGSPKKSDATGAISTISEQSFQGRVAGVSISNNSVRIRGASSISNNGSPGATSVLAVRENEKTTTTSYEIELPYTIPTNGKEYQVDIKEVNLPAFYQYAVAPKLDKDAFLTAFLTDWEQYNLVEGEANLYFEGTFLGKTLLKTNSTDDTLKISLGRDKNVVVTRTKLKEFNKNKFLSSKRIETRAFEISIKNKKSTPLSIVIEDQIPIAVDKQIDVEHEAVGAIVDKLKGRLTWKIELKSLEDRKLKFSYTVKHPADWNVFLD